MGVGPVGGRAALEIVDRLPSHVLANPSSLCVVGMHGGNTGEHRAEVADGPGPTGRRPCLRRGQVGHGGVGVEGLVVAGQHRSGIWRAQLALVLEQPDLERLGADGRERAGHGAPGLVGGDQLVRQLWQRADGDAEDHPVEIGHREVVDSPALLGMLEKSLGGRADGHDEEELQDLRCPLRPAVPRQPRPSELPQRSRRREQRDGELTARKRGEPGEGDRAGGGAGATPDPPRWSAE